MFHAGKKSPTYLTPLIFKQKALFSAQPMLFKLKRNFNKYDSSTFKWCVFATQGKYKKIHDERNMINVSRHY